MFKGAGHDLAHVLAEVGLGGDALDRRVRRAAVRLGELAPAGEHAREALARVAAKPDLSDDVREVVSRALGEP